MRDTGAGGRADASDVAGLLSLKHSHPRWLVARWLTRWPAGETEQLLERNNEVAPIAVRPYGVVREQLEASLEESGVRVADVPLVEDSVRLSGSVSLTELGAYRQGLFFVQDPGATLVTRYAAFPPGSVVADLCAGDKWKALGDASYEKFRAVPMKRCMEELLDASFGPSARAQAAGQ